MGYTGRIPRFISSVFIATDLTIFGGSSGYSYIRPKSKGKEAKGERKQSLGSYPARQRGFRQTQLANARGQK